MSVQTPASAELWVVTRALSDGSEGTPVGPDPRALSARPYVPRAKRSTPLLDKLGSDLIPRPAGGLGYVFGDLVERLWRRGVQVEFHPSLVSWLMAQVIVTDGAREWERLAEERVAARLVPHLHPKRRFEGPCWSATSTATSGSRRSVELPRAGPRATASTRNTGRQRNQEAIPRPFALEWPPAAQVFGLAGCSPLVLRTRAPPPTPGLHGYVAGPLICGTPRPATCTLWNSWSSVRPDRRLPEGPPRSTRSLWTEGVGTIPAGPVRRFRSEVLAAGQPGSGSAPAERPGTGFPRD